MKWIYDEREARVICSRQLTNERVCLSIRSSPSKKGETKIGEGLYLML